MSVSYLKTDPDAAYKILDQLEQSGWDLYMSIEQDYNKAREVTPQQVDQWYRSYEQWRSAVGHRLNEVFVSPNEANEFRYAKGSPGVTLGENHKHSNVQNSILGRIYRLVEFKTIIRDRFEVHLVSIIQNGDNNEAIIQG